VSKDTYKLVTEYPITQYRCGARAGDRVRLRREMVVRDHKGKPTKEVHPAGEVWTVLRGTSEEPPVIWLRQPDGKSHTWSDDDDFLQSFEIVR
jgi:hypothetical protein